jgi:hypothetical protein
VDHVDDVFAADGLAEPVGVGRIDRAADTRQRTQDAVEVLRQDEDVEVLGVADDAGVAREGVGAANQERRPAVWSASSMRA